MTFKSSIQRELDQIFRLACDETLPLRVVSKSAFTQARSKLDPEVFISLNKTATQAFYQSADFNTWSGMRLLGIDGSTLALPDHASVREKFSVHNFGCHADQPRCMARISLVYDVLNQLTLDAQIAPFASHETDLFSNHLPVLLPCDLVLMDRGFSAPWIMFALSARNVNFCIRARAGWWNAAKDFLNSGAESQIIQLRLPQKHAYKLSQFPGWENKELICRLVRVELEDGQVQVICTSLLDEELHTNNSFKELYHLRWKQEEAYKMLKIRMNMEQFSGKTAHAILQDFYAKVLTMNLCAIYSYPIQERIEAENAQSINRKNPQKLNRTHAIANTYHLIQASAGKDLFEKLLAQFDKVIEKAREIIKGPRSFPRKKKYKKTQSMNYKPL
jgi:Transposase DDE domain